MQSNNEIGALNRYVSTDTLLLIGRVLFSLIFIWSGWSKITGFDGTVGYIEHLGVPLPSVVNVIEIVLEFGGGLALFFGVLFRLATIGLLVHTILASFVVHHFWSVPDAEAYIQTIQFMKNVTIVGGLLFLNVQGPGAMNLGKMLGGK